jgi:hypothetical protein
MHFIKLTSLLAGFIACCGLSNAASAGTFTYQSYQFSGENVHITDNLLGIDNEYGGAGLITLDGSSIITAYCVDIANWLLGSGTYNTGVDPALDSNLAGTSVFTGHSKIADISALIYYGTYAAAVQLAIWETEYSGVTITPDNLALQPTADTYFTNLLTVWSVPNTLTLMELTPANGQTNQTLVYMAKVAEPASMTILGSALMVVGYLRKRRGQR